MSVLHRSVLVFLKTAVSPINLLTQSTKLVVGVSGGPDSLALLHVLTQVLPPHRLVVAHLNHDYRKTAVSEATFVHDIAKAWGVTFQTKTVDIVQLSQQSGDSLEETGRKARYQFFQEVAEAYKTPYIVVGHHGDDQAETILMNLLRGTGLRGLRGMLPVTRTTSAQAENIDCLILRPFLDIGRQEIEAYCQENALTPVFDESNEDISFFRNRIRQELLPLLTDYNAGIGTHLRQLATLTAADVAILDDVVAETWAQVSLSVNAETVVLDRAAWTALSLGLRRRILRQALVTKRPFLQDITFQAIEQARLVAEKNETGQRFDLPGNLTLIVDYDRLIISDKAQVVLDNWPQTLDEQPIELTIPSVVKLADGWKIEATLVDLVSIPEIKANADKWQVFVQMPQAQALWIRSREPGERFQPLGMNGRSAKVKEVMINRKIGARWRANWPLVVDKNAQIIWLVGHIMDDRMKITGETSSILKLHCYRG